ncbi:uncharacterized protein LACBIDRAFT_335186 [Laccaria bicolor S238N-H82]|uniref:Predicted protein n=1 Tax=Laccaria bicolor (strain S238N-H82 / ATCC MYA-4686) TaxID=486041 RepID=B0E1M2_LACBS|nr:uncharacterized protein LACBIDRAFT_335186 [Laccaria bicolor S238N-H82]EDQ99290.1 predicted protein [Laccaria bicolor S238N-H82]|eukprot:XP_001890100.1 predicted protein [Laccaria bicolor S238N-H82]
MCSFIAIVAVLTSALLASAQVVPQGQAAPKAQAAAAQACWRCPSDQGQFKFQQQAGSDPLHCQFLKDGMAYYCDYKVCDSLLNNPRDARMRFWSEVDSDDVAIYQCDARFIVIQGKYGIGA